MSRKQILILIVSAAVSLGRIIASMAFNVPRSFEPYCLILLVASNAVLLSLLVLASCVKNQIDTPKNLPCLKFRRSDLKNPGRSTEESGQMPYLLRLCANRAFTSFLMSPVGSALSIGK
jgi:hypothetical protein